MGMYNFALFIPMYEDPYDDELEAEESSFFRKEILPLLQKAEELDEEPKYSHYPNCCDVKWLSGRQFIMVEGKGVHPHLLMEALDWFYLRREKAPCHVHSYVPSLYFFYQDEGSDCWFPGRSN